MSWPRAIEESGAPSRSAGVLDAPGVGRLRIGGEAAVDLLCEDRYAERRRRPRLRISKTVKVYDPVSGRYFAGHTDDVSDCGLRLTLPARLPAVAGQTAAVLVSGANGRAFVEHNSLVPVRWVWVRRDPKRGTLTAGVEVLGGTGSGTAWDDEGLTGHALAA